MTTGTDVVATARGWLNTRWSHQKFLKGVGVDCVGLIGGVALELGLPGAELWRDTTAYHNYGRQPDPRLLLAGCALLMDKHEGDRELGDVLVLKFAREPQHFGILSALDPPYMIHALAQARKVVEARIDEVWAARIVGSYRLRGVT